MKLRVIGVEAAESFRGKVLMPADFNQPLDEASLAASKAVE
jgi:hypothetical protein